MCNDKQIELSSWWGCCSLHASWLLEGTPLSSSCLELGSNTIYSCFAYLRRVGWLPTKYDKRSEPKKRSWGEREKRFCVSALAIVSFCVFVYNCLWLLWGRWGTSNLINEVNQIIFAIMVWVWCQTYILPGLWRSLQMFPILMIQWWFLISQIIYV